MKVEIIHVSVALPFRKCGMMPSLIRNGKGIIVDVSCPHHCQNVQLEDMDENRIIDLWNEMQIQ